MSSSPDASLPNAGSLVRSLRGRRGVSLRTLASELGVSPSTLSALENGHTAPTIDRLERIAAILDAPASELVPHESAPAPAAHGSSPRLVSLTDEPSLGDFVTVAGVVLPTVNTRWREFETLELDAPVTGALNTFLELGYHGASMRVIAERAGLSVAGVYHHYPSKQELLVSIMDLTMVDLLGRSRGALLEGVDAGPVQRFTLLVECLALFQTNRRVLGFIGRSETRSIVGEGARRLLSARLEEQRMIDDEIREAVELGAFHVDSVEGAGRAVTNLCSSLVHWFRPAGHVRAEAVAGEYAGYCLNIVGYRE